MSAELKLVELLQTPEAGLALAQLSISQGLEISIRQSACILLRKYVTERWSPYFGTFKGSAPPVEVKTQIRQAIFQGLSDPARKIRSLCARTLSTIADCDWPDEYPELLDSLINIISSDSPDAVHGAMQMFTEFIKSDLTEDQILPVLRQLLPVLLAILGAAERHSPLTRSRTISVFRQCVTALFMVKDQHPQAVKEATASVLPVWLDAFKVLLSIDPQQDVSGKDVWDGLAIRIQIFKTLDTIYTSFPKTLTPYLQDFLNASLYHLQALLPTFTQYYLSPDNSAPRTSEDEPIDLAQLVCPLLDFVNNVTRGGKAKSWYEQGHLAELVRLMFDWMQMTSDDEESWSSNANAFVAQEEDETQVYGVRVAGFEVLATLLDRMPIQTTATFQSVVQQVVTDSRQAKELGNRDWWRPLEAALAAVGSQAESVADCIEDEVASERPKPIDIEALLTDVVPSLLGMSECPFLQGRGFVFASQYAKLLPSNLAGQYLEAAVQVIEAQDAGIPIKISAVKAVQNFCQGMEASIIIPFAPRIAADLGPFLLMTSEDTLSLVLDTVSVVLDIDDGKWLSVELASSLTSAVLDVWSKNIKDPLFISLLGEILSSLAGSNTPGTYEIVVRQALPVLSSAMGSAKPDESWIAESALELTTGLVEGAPDSGLGDGFFATLAPPLFMCLKSTEDRDVLQNGTACLTLIIRKDVGQLLAWSDAEGRSGLENVLTLIAKLLENQDESGGLFIGDLIIHLLRRAGDAVLPVLPEMLRAMVGRMSTAKTASFIQSLIIPFCFLINNQRDTVLSLLESTQIQGRSGLDIFIQTWCENAETFQGFWPNRVSSLALCQLYTCERPSLQNLMVKGDIVVKPETSNVIMTRSRTRNMPTEFTSVPFPVKAIKLLLKDLQLGAEPTAMNAPSDAGDIDSDDGDEDWEEEEKSNQGFKEDEFAFLSDMLGGHGMTLENDDLLEDTDDQDLRNDPVSQMDMQQHLVMFFKECASRNTNNFQGVAGQLSASEMQVLQKVVGQ
ncbi:ARM repeat-containing protein [Gloeophyllum trabeum ATCC 11539]|uniref:ARM repeat-containing protein n=1 Tax=Gloeophyllum trabeum (strain ATCC 11539 / FP-39264 / Madison 617) TaxID=670483 RepID=S7QL74_GLOTA|nr:ARM repeat-containing protein [Gloeophyllum trabeum ATCC 11539]EPQ60043.1 ARM repeat-containing protein [Gloeophyllum trabeum ATCC 11539]